MPGPHFFVDRSLGRKQVPTALRAAGGELVPLAEHYGIPADEAVEDVEWLELAGENQWPVLMKDERIRYRPAERGAVIAQGGPRVLPDLREPVGRTDGRAPRRESERRLASRRGRRAGLFAVSRGGVREIPLDD